MYNINLPGLPDFSKIDFSNIDLSQFGVPTPAGVAPVQPQVLAAAPAPVPAFDPYAGMTQADLAEIGMAAPMPQMVAPAPAPVPVPQPTAPVGIETMAPNFAMTEDFALPVGEPSIPVPVPQPVVQTPAPAPIPTPTPAPQPVAPAPTPEVVEPVPAAAPAFDPYAGMTQADLAEIGMAAPMPQRVAPPVQTPAPVPVPTPTPVPQPAFDPYAGMTQADLAAIGAEASLLGIEGLAPNFAMTEDFARPVNRGQPMPAVTGPVPEPQVAPAPVTSVPPTIRATGEDFVLPADQEAFMGAREPVDFNPYSPEMNAETLMGTPDTPNVNNVAQSLINTGPITLPNGETFDIRDLDLTGLDLSGFTPPQEAINEAQGTTPARGARAGEDLARIPGGYFAPASDYYTDGQLADMGIEPGTTVSTGANPQQPAGTPLNLSPEQQAAIDNWLANNPPGTVINLPGGGSVTVPDYTGPTRTVNPNDLMLQNLQIQQGQGGRGGSVATQFGLRGVAPTQPVERGNPFRRPGDEGIASLVPSGG
jgi:hypothetical protein